MLETLENGTKSTTNFHYDPCIFFIRILWRDNVHNTFMYKNKGVIEVETISRKDNF